jgi:metal-responsive CopG/Arc/MetJ family transcriptional regulator
MAKKIISISISPEILQTIDKLKGLASRSIYIEFLLKEKLSENGTN